MVILVEAVGEEGTQKEASEAKSYAAQVDTPGPEENTNEEFPTDDNNNTSRISSTGDDRDFLSTQSSSNSKDDQGMSAQDAALHTEQGRAVPADFSVIVHDDNSSTSLPTSSPSVASSELSNPRLPVLAEESLSQKSRRTSKRLIRGRHHGRSRVALIDVCETKRKGLPTPSNQYECILIRRAVLPLEPKNSKNIGDVTVEVQDDVYGDISLGMKLSVADTGHVIVQRVTRLADGRASPAQLTGMIQRGDVLLAIDGVSLTENALAGLSPLRAPDDRRVPCQRQYKLRFAAAEGLSMLKSIENQRASISAGNAGNLASELLALFPMVDQLSGMPLFEEQHDQENQRPAVVPLPEAPPEIVPDATPSRKKVEVVPLDEQISESLSTLRVMDRNQYLLNCKDMSSMHAACTATEQLFLTLPQRQEMGRKALIGARNLINQVENIDAGKDLRSFQSWNTTLSLYSRASTRRRRVFDTASLPVNFGRLEEDKEDDDDSCAGSEKSSTNSEQLDGDELLLRLAAHDEIWRKQVIEFLEKVAQESNDSDSDDSNDVKEAESSDINLALSNELGSFLFGENMSKILAKHKTPRALPSEEVTAVLFDLATKLSASVPDEIKASGTIMTSKSRLTPISGLKRHAADSDAVLAARFLLDSALPAWLKSFRPLAWEHRRILWPVDRVRLGGSTAASTLSDDSLTVDSSQSTSARHRKRKNLREIIEDQELTIETRGET